MDKDKRIILCPCSEFEYKDLLSKVIWRSFNVTVIN